MPGEADLSAYVDFASLKSVTSKYQELQSFDILPQGFFLEAMGISARVDMLIKKNPTKVSALTRDYERLASPDHMGEIYKCLYVGQKSLGDVFPFGNNLTYEKNS